VTRLRTWLRRQASAIVLVAIIVALNGASYLAYAHQQGTYEASQRREQAAARMAGELVEFKLCLTFGKLAALKPPAGNPVKNPARGFEQQEHATLDELGTDLGCR
jgi:hypothetical protein